MYYNPENEDGWNTKCVCPYCKADAVTYAGKSEIRDGGTAVFEVTEGKCINCGKKVMIVDKLRPKMYGVFKRE